MPKLARIAERIEPQWSRVRALCLGIAKSLRRQAEAHDVDAKLQRAQTSR